MRHIQQVCLGFVVCLAALGTPSLLGQGPYPPEHLDLTGDIAAPRLESSIHKPLPEQYIWAGGTADSEWARERYFRHAFTVKTPPRVATLYVAGPDRVRVYLNGTLLANAERDPKSKIRPMVLALDATHSLRPGRNVLALEVSHGERLVAKIVGAPLEVMAPALTMSGPGWKYSLSASDGWEKPDFSDRAWQAAEASGSIEGNIEYFQWNGDAGMYRWPGYDGISPFLAHVPASPQEVNYGFQGLGRFDNLSVLAQSPQPPSNAREFTVHLPSGAPGRIPKEEYPYVVLDFGRESDGRLEVISDSPAAMKLDIQYGESLDEAYHDPYLGADELVVPPHGDAFGPKSAFRYALVRFLEGAQPLRFKTIRLDSVYYPVSYRGSFESSDALLNRIWQVGAYTAHLCMQDGIWDAPKRDRGRWMGDLDVSGRVIDTVFADHLLMQATLDKLIHDTGHPVHDEVNTIPGYSAFWVMGQADYYRHFGDAAYLHSITTPLVELLTYMESELDDQDLFASRQKHWPFVDWSPDLNENTAESRRATTLEFYKAFSEGAYLLREAGDTANAGKFAARAEAIRQAALKSLLDPESHTFGPRWQTNAMAIFSGVADPALAASIWDNVLSHPRHFQITPYYNFYVITAMAESGHRQEALDWIREYWGGMIKAGATSFWEAWDPTWPTEHFHGSLQADNGQGYFVSLSHGWSSGPTAWLTEQVLGIQPTAAGFREVTIRPDLMGLEWARGAEPTPHGLIKVDLRRASGLEATLDVPDGVDAQVSVPVTKGETSVEVNGQATTGTPAEDGTRLVIHLTRAGTYKVVAP